MIICGLKLSHDAGVAVIDGQRLVFSIELEKLSNHKRYSEIGDLRAIEEILKTEGIDLADIDSFVVDGWWTTGEDRAPSIATAQWGTGVTVPVAPYTSDDASDGLLHRFTFDGVPGGPLQRGYASYSHASNHALGSYCTSPFAARGEAALVLAWDGGMLPRLYRVSPAPLSVGYLGQVLPMMGDTFSYLCKELEPFAAGFESVSDEEYGQRLLEVPGKAMAYAALGSSRQEAFPVFQKLLDTVHPMSFGLSLGEAVAARRAELFDGMSSADLIASFQDYVGQQLRQSLTALVGGARDKLPRGICLSGGCALNIKWNSVLRDSGLFDEIWVPPFPNDSGAALGTACCELIRETGQAALEWNVYSGPRLLPSQPAPGWASRPCTEHEVAAILQEHDGPVVVLDGRAELGPRALGNRSLLATATDASMKDRLNEIKGRAAYRPVAPICVESQASEVFEPGNADRHMLFEHRLRQGWAARIPAIVHLDGTARLQTIDSATAGTAASRILAEYWRLTGIPVLCNTSANLAGHGFFPDVETATRWGQARYVWSAGTLYTHASVAPAGNTRGQGQLPTGDLA
jgi:carbamoyltransferase